YAQHEDRYFVPASNTKLLTLYTALNVLGDSIPAFRYEIKEDSLIIWGTGDPSFLHPKLDNGKVYDFLSNSPYRIFLAEDSPLDFEPSYWRADLAHFPIYGNMASLSVSNSGELNVFPLGLRDFLAVDSTFQSDRFQIRRSKIGDGLTYPALKVPVDFKENVPFPANLQAIRILLQDTLKKEVQLVKRKKHDWLQTFYSIPSDSLYKHMMLPSDNFLAEQILLLCASELSDTLEIKKSIEYSLENLLQDLKSTPIWEDGSGLSRYNMFTPRSVLQVLNKLENEIGNTERLKMLLPAGGVSGTLRTAYQLDEGQPFVWAKTGSLRNMHLQSGWLETK
ncbi:MAG: D-alanyl-D-alanine carboxypeptidase, partial [Cyclobacteriaceae bacterium]|nr:D-alanyl-D-alanine carboxypeptidase [Cyclobacteriaceae bacterium]